MVPKRVGDELRQRRVLVGMTQEDIAARLPNNKGGFGVTRAYVSAVEQGVDWDPDADKLAAWALVLGWESDYLLRKLGRTALPIEATPALTPALIEAIGLAVAAGVRSGVADALNDLARQAEGEGPPPPLVE